MKALSKMTGGRIPAYRLGAHVSVSESKLKENLDDRLEKLRNRGQQPMICYEVATHAARSGNAITKAAEIALKGEKNYSARYLALMDINDTTLRPLFSSIEISESGFLNFKCRGAGVQHTAYIHKDADGTLTLVHNNGLSLDQELSQTHKSLERRGGANIYNLTAGHDADINRYLIKNNLVMHYTPASHVNAKC
ncbi:hypothetical protein D3C77_428380 [compost metagenome]